MDERIMEYLINPRTGKVLLDIARAGRMKVSELCRSNPSIPRSTMYRILTKMERDGLVTVVDYQQKRGTVEKTYSIHPDAFPKPGEGADEVTYDDLLSFFIAYCMEFAIQFRDRALKNPGVVGQDEVMGFWTAPVYATDRELSVLLQNFGQQISKYSQKSADGERRLHSVGFIISPAADDSGEGGGQ